MTWAWRSGGHEQQPAQPAGWARRIDVDGINVWDFADGRVERCRGYLGMGLVDRQLGVMSSPGSRGERVGVMLQRAPGPLRAAVSPAPIRRRSGWREHHELRGSAHVCPARRARVTDGAAALAGRVQDRVPRLHTVVGERPRSSGCGLASGSTSRARSTTSWRLDPVRRLDPAPPERGRLQRHAEDARPDPAAPGGGGGRRGSSCTGARPSGQPARRRTASHVEVEDSSAPPPGSGGAARRGCRHSPRGWPTCGGACARAGASSPGPTKRTSRFAPGTTRRECGS